MRLLILFLSLPWWLYFPMAGGVAWYAYDSSAARNASAAEVEAAIAAPPPATVNMTAGIPPRTGPVPEVSLRAQVDTDRTTELVQRTNGVVTSRHIMYVLVAAEATVTPEAVEGLIILPMHRQEALVEYLVENSVGFGPVGPIVKIDGLLGSSGGKASHAREALEEQGADHVVLNRELVALATNDQLRVKDQVQAVYDHQDG